MLPHPDEFQTRWVQQVKSAKIAQRVDRLSNSFCSKSMAWGNQFANSHRCGQNFVHNGGCLLTAACIKLKQPKTVNDLKHTELDGTQIVDIEGRIDSGNANDVQKSLADIVEKTSGALVISLEHVDYISSAGLRVLLLTFKSLSADKRGMALAALNPDVRDIMHITGFEKILSCHDTVDAAVQELSAP